MMGHQGGNQERRFYSFNLESHVPADQMLGRIDRCLDPGDLGRQLARFYSHTGPTSIDPELMVRMLLIGYSFGYSFERRLSEGVQLNRAYRGFCRLEHEDVVPDHSTFPSNRRGPFRESDLFRPACDEHTRSDPRTNHWPLPLTPKARQVRGSSTEQAIN